MARRTLRWNKDNRDRGLVDFDFKDWSTSTLNWSMSTNLSAEEVDIGLAKASAALCCISPALGKSLGRKIKRFNLGRWPSCFWMTRSRLQTFAVQVVGWTSRVSKGSSSKCFGSPPSRLKVRITTWVPAASQCAISLDWSMIGRDRSTSGLARRTLRWSKRSQDRGLVDFDFLDWSTSNLDWP